MPSQTEYLFDLGLDEEVVGITKFCIHPDKWFKNKTRVGGTKKVDIEKVRALAPDLIIANKEENTKEDIEALSDFCPVWTSDIISLDDAYAMMRSLGDMTGRSTEASQWVHDIESAFTRLKLHGQKRRKAAYLIWQEPFMSLNADTFIHHMMDAAGFENVFGHRTESRYPVIELHDLVDSGAEYIFLSTEPFPFSPNHVATLKAQLPLCKVMIVDGEMFSWYGSRMKQAAQYFASLLDTDHNGIDQGA